MKNFLLCLLICSLSYAQDQDYTPVHLREIPKYNLLIELGLSQPTGHYKDLALSGTQLAIGSSIYVNKHWGLSAQVQLASNTNRLTHPDTQNRLDNWSSTTVSLGAVYSHTFNRFQVDAFLRGGLGFYTYDNQPGLGRKNKDLIGPFVGEITSVNNASNDSATILQTGLRFNYYFRRSVQVYFSPSYNTTLGQPLVINTTIGGDVVGNDELFNMNNIQFNVGVKFALSARYSNGELRKDD